MTDERNTDKYAQVEYGREEAVTDPDPGRRYEFAGEGEDSRWNYGDADTEEDGVQEDHDLIRSQNEMYGT